jgi:phosphatidylinositol alpha-mannosyltransferase
MTIMKIGLICPYNITKGGGVQEIVLALQAELTKRGHYAKIITPLPRDSDVVEMPEVIFVGGSTDLRSPTHTTVQISVTADTTKLDEMLSHEEFDILHFHEPWVPVLSRQILQRSNSVNIATFHAKVPETQMSRSVARVFTPYLKSVMNYLHELTAVSTSAAEYADGLTDQPITIIPNGIDLHVYKPSKKKPADSAKTILYIGRLERRKGVKYLLNAFQIISQKDPNLQLIIAGDGPDREKLELLTEDLKLKNVRFLGYITDKKKLELLSSVDLFCSPAICGESFGIVLLEAMASGLVTIAGNNSGYIDVLDGLGAISIVNPQDDDEFARRLMLLLYNTTLRDLWKTWAAEHVQQFSYTKIVDNYEALYRKALSDHVR